MVGCSTQGLDLSGCMHEYYLPHSGIHIREGEILQVYNEFQFKDGVGQIPDIWCNPKDALQAVYNLLIKEGLANENTIKALPQY